MDKLGGEKEKIREKRKIREPPLGGGLFYLSLLFVQLGEILINLTSCR